MSVYETLDRLMAEQKGIIRTADVVSLGISKPYFYKYAKDRNLEKVSQGVYVYTNAWADPLYLLSLRSQQIIFSHETALYLHGLTTREPNEFIVTVKTGYNPSRLKKDGVKVYTVKEELYELGLITMLTPFGNDVKVYNKERTVCDILRSRTNVEIQSFQEAIKGYLQGNQKNLRLLWKYAKVLKVENLLRQYTEVLL